jgi:chromosome segregation ATPase
MNKETDALGILEEKIIQLVEAYAAIKTEKTVLAEKLLQRETELKELRGKVTVFSDEREMAKKKLENLLSRIDRMISPGKQG